MPPPEDGSPLDEEQAAILRKLIDDEHDVGESPLVAMREAFEREREVVAFNRRSKP